MIKYSLNFSGGKTNSNLFKNDLYDYVNKKITRFFTFDGTLLELEMSEDDFKVLEFFVSKFNGNIIIIDEIPI